MRSGFIKHSMSNFDLVTTIVLRTFVSSSDIRAESVKTSACMCCKRNYAASIYTETQSTELVTTDARSIVLQDLHFAYSKLNLIWGHCHRMLRWERAQMLAGWSPVLKPDEVEAGGS